MVVDFDQTGLRVTGKKFELAELFGDSGVPPLEEEPDQLRRQGIRTSKAEMIELLVWQYVPDQPTEDSRRFWRHSGSWRRERAWPDFVPGPQA